MPKKPQADAKTRSNSKTQAEEAPADKPKAAKPKTAAKPKASRAEEPAIKTAEVDASELGEPDIELHVIEVEEAEDGEPDDVIVRERAYAIWVEEGHPHGRDEEHWHRARGELKGKPKSRSKPKSKK